MAGVWTHRDLVTDTYSFADLLDIHEFLDVKEENEWLAQEWMERQAKNSR